MLFRSVRAGARPRHLRDAPVRQDAALQDVGEGIRVASVTDPFGNLFGIIENPNFRLPDQK